MSIYLDHSATTPVDKSVLDKMLPYFTQNFGNPSSVHEFGQNAVMATDNAREQIANYIGAQIEEIIFTSGATEANNLAINGLVAAIKEQGIKKPHIITSSIEHPSIKEPCKKLEYQGIEVTYLKVDSSGIINVEDLKKSIKNNTVLVSIMWANNEVGSIQPIQKIGKIIKKINERKQLDWKNANPKTRGTRPHSIYFHTDATQALNFLHSLDVIKNNIDLLSFSGHKIYGPKGVGALYVKNNTPLYPIQIGGGQENNRRSGTLNTTGIIGLGAAINLLTKNKVEKNNKLINKLRNILIKDIKSEIPNAILNTNINNSIPSVANFSFPNKDGEAIMIALDLNGISVSTGSACGAGKLKTSYVLSAMGVKKNLAQSSIRFSLGKNNTGDEIKKVIKILASI